MNKLFGMLTFCSKFTNYPNCINLEFKSILIYTLTSMSIFLMRGGVTESYISSQVTLKLSCVDFIK